MKELSVRGKSIWKLYLGLHGWFAFLYGAFASYCYLYLGIQVRLAGGMEYLPRGLLPFMAGTLLIEALSAPIAGAYADACGRRAAVKRGLHLLALSYAGLASLPILRALIADPGSAGFWVLWIGLASIALMSIAAAFHANALDAWFVDELLDSPPRASLLKMGNAKPDLHRYFARQSQVFGACLLIGGVLTLWLGRGLADSSRRETLALLSPGSAIWVFGSLGALWIAQRMGNRLGAPEAPVAATAAAAAAAKKAAVVQKAHQKKLPAAAAQKFAAAEAIARPKLDLYRRFKEVMRSRELVRALLLSSAVYFCGLAVIYFLPELLRERGGEASLNPSAAWLTEHYWVFYIALGLTRVFGPTLALNKGPRRPSYDNTPLATLNLGAIKGFAFRKRQAWYWGALGFGGVAASGVAFLAAPGKWFLLPLAMIILAKLAIEAFKPVQASYLNELASSSSRAFSLSLATPFGSAALGGLALVIVGLEGAAPGNLPLQQARLAIPLAFSVLGLITLLILRAVTRPIRSAALGEDWKKRVERVREEMRKEEDEITEDFIRPLGAGDLPLMRPGNGLKSAELIRAGSRVQKPAYLKDTPAETPLATPAPAASTAQPPAGPPGRAIGGRPRPNLRIVYSRPNNEPNEGAGES